MVWDRGQVQAHCSERFGAMFLPQAEYQKLVMGGTTRPELLWERCVVGVGARMCVYIQRRATWTTPSLTLQPTKS